MTRQTNNNKLGGQKPGRIAVVRMLKGLGDLLCVVPALRALRASFPKAYIVLISLSPAHQFVARFHHYIDELVECPGFPGIPETALKVGDIPVFLKSMQKRSFDIALQMHGNGVITNVFTVLLGASFNAGFYLPGEFCPDEERFLPYNENRSEVLRYLDLMEFLDIPAGGNQLEFPLWKVDLQALSGMPETAELWQKDFVCIHPGASDRTRRWTPERFALVADALADRGLSVVLTGDVNEVELSRRVRGAARCHIVDLTGRTTLGVLGVLLSRARMLICNDTGISHVAAALQVPSVVVFTNSNPQRWAPLNQDLHRSVSVAGNGGARLPVRVSPHEDLRDNGRSGQDGTTRRPVPSAEDVIATALDLLFCQQSYGAME